MKPPIKSLKDLKGGAVNTGVYAKASPKKSRLQKAKVLTPEEKAAFLLGRPDLERKG